MHLQTLWYDCPLALLKVLLDLKRRRNKEKKKKRKRKKSAFRAMSIKGQNLGYNGPHSHYLGTFRNANSWLHPRPTEWKPLGVRRAADYVLANPPGEAQCSGRTTVLQGQLSARLLNAPPFRIHYPSQPILTVAVFTPEPSHVLTRKQPGVRTQLVTNLTALIRNKNSLKHIKTQFMHSI